MSLISYSRSTPVPGMRGGGWTTPRLARERAYHCFGCTRPDGQLVIKERREYGVRSYGAYHRECIPPGRRA